MTAAKNAIVTAGFELKSSLTHIQSSLIKSGKILMRAKALGKDGKTVAGDKVAFFNWFEVLILE